MPSCRLARFEVLMLFALPGIALVILVAGRRYRTSRGAVDRSLRVASVLLVLVQVAHFACAALGITQQLWKQGRGFYFSENDVLHVGMIGWLAYVLASLGRDLDLKSHEGWLRWTGLVDASIGSRRGPSCRRAGEKSRAASVAWSRILAPLPTIRTIAACGSG